MYPDLNIKHLASMVVREIKNLAENDKLDIGDLRYGKDLRLALAKSQNKPAIDMSQQYWHGGGISNITGLLIAGTGITLTGSGTTSSPYTINATATGAVTSVTSADANATITNPTTTPVITIVSAPKLQTARTINGTSFDGTASITVTAAAGTLTGTVLNSTVVTSSLTALGTITVGVWSGTTIAIANGGTGQVTANAALNAFLPSQVGNNGKFLTTDGANTSWATVAGGSGTVTNVASADGSITVTNPTTTVDLAVVKAPKLTTARTIGGVSFDGTANITVATATGGFTVSGGNLALGANSISMSGSIGATLTRVTKLWATDVDSTNMFTVGGTSLSSTFSPIAGSASIITVGTITSGVWNGTTIAFANGGTGIASWTQYLIPYAATTTSIGQIPIGTSGQVLTSNGAGAAPSFQTAAGGGFSSYMEAIVTATQTYTTDFSYQVIQFDSKRFDGLSEFNTTTHLFTANATGYYFVHARINFTGSAASQSGNLAIQVNGTRVAQTNQNSSNPGGNWQTLEITDLVSVTAGQTIGVYVSYSAGSGTITLGGDSTATGNTALVIYRVH